MSLNLRDAIQRQYDQLNGGNSTDVPADSPRPNVPTRPTIPQSLLDALKQTPITLPQGTGTTNRAAPPPTAMPPAFAGYEGRDSLTSNQPFTKPTAPITGSLTPLSEATSRVQSAFPKMDKGWAGILGAGSAIVGEAGRAINAGWSGEQEGGAGDAPVGKALGQLPMIGTGIALAQAFMPQSRKPLETPLGDIPVVCGELGNDRR
jgi:hypothetical protein